MNVRWNRTLLILAVIGLVLYFSVNALYGLHHEDEISGENPTVTKQEAADAAVAFIKERFKLKELSTFVIYQSEKTRSGYLQRAHLLESYDKTYGGRFPLDYYVVEAAASGQQAHYFVKVNYDNREIVGWTTRAGEAKLPTASSEKLARAALQEKGWNADDFKLQPPDPEAPNQLIYEKSDEKIGEAKLQVRLAFSAAGALIVYEPGFSIPQADQDWLERQNQLASRMTLVSTCFSVLLAIGGIITAIIARKRIHMRKGLLLTAAFTVLYVMNNINMYPAFKSMIGTVDTYPGGAIVGLLVVNLFTLLVALSVYIALATGHELWRQAGLTRLSWPYWSDQDFGRSTLTGMGRGYLLALFILGVQQTLFYIGEEGFDIWSVNDPSNSLLNMLVPGLFPLMAWAAAISEEAVYRLFGIALFKKLLRFEFIAVLVPSVFWAASHTLYPIYPVYTRLIEVTVIGIILGYAYLKYGFMTTLFAHACMDSILMGMSLFGLKSGTNIALGLFYIVLPALTAWALAWLHKKRRLRTGWDD